MINNAIGCIIYSTCSSAYLRLVKLDALWISLLHCCFLEDVFCLFVCWFRILVSMCFFGMHMFAVCEYLHAHTGGSKASRNVIHIPLRKGVRVTHQITPRQSEAVDVWLRLYALCMPSHCKSTRVKRLPSSSLNLIDPLPRYRDLSRRPKFNIGGEISHDTNEGEEKCCEIQANSPNS